MSMVPWYVQLYFHSMAVTRDGHSIVPPESAFSDHRFRPAVQRSTPTLLEFVLQLPPVILQTIYSATYLHSYLLKAEHQLLLDQVRQGVHGESLLPL
jgi:hypothetical protein